MYPYPRSITGIVRDMFIVGSWIGVLIAFWEECPWVRPIIGWAVVVLVFWFAVKERG